MEWIDLPTTTSDGKARAESIKSVQIQTGSTSIVTYHSAGNLLVVGSRAFISIIHQLLDSYQNLSPYFLVCGDENNGNEISQSELPETLLMADNTEMTGHLGAFAVSVTKDDRVFDLPKTLSLSSGAFDLIFEFSSAPSIPSEIPPPGYYWLDSESLDDDQIVARLNEIDTLVGNFDKPKYYRYDPDICAHSRSGIKACTRCIDACPTDAIISIGEMVEVDSYLCQGGGSCATACPTGAVTYAYPPAENLLQNVKQLVQNYHAAGGKNCVILFYDQEHGQPIVQQNYMDLAENIFPVEIEEVGSIGIDAYLSLLAYGAAGAMILCVNTPPSVLTELKFQLSILNELLTGLGYAADAVTLVNPDSLHDNPPILEHKPDWTPAKFQPSGIKRTDIRIALDHLYEQATIQPVTLPLSANAPFGEIQVNLDTCTLCMGCVSVCPASALEAGGEVPKLSFIEHNCVQCGMCEQACPENSITLQSRYVFDTDQRMRAHTLNEDAPFHCRVCGKPFATNLILNRMKEKLKGHHMFQTADAVMRLEMCEDCRVKDMFAAEGGFPRHRI